MGYRISWNLWTVGKEHTSMMRAKCVFQVLISALSVATSFYVVRENALWLVWYAEKFMSVFSSFWRYFSTWTKPASQLSVLWALPHFHEHSYYWELHSQIKHFCNRKSWAIEDILNIKRRSKRHLNPLMPLGLDE